MKDVMVKKIMSWLENKRTVKFSSNWFSRLSLQKGGCAKIKIDKSFVALKEQFHNLLLPVSQFVNVLASWCSGYRYCTTSFNRIWTQVQCKFKTCSQRFGCLWRSELPVRVPPEIRLPTRQGNRAPYLSSQFCTVVFLCVCM